MAAISPPAALFSFCGPMGRRASGSLKRTTSMSGEPRQRKLGSADADGNWQLGLPTAANNEKTQTVTGYKRRAPTAAADAPFNADNLQEAVRHNAAKEKEKEKAVEAKPVDEGEQPVPKAEEEQAAAAKRKRESRNSGAEARAAGKRQVGVAARLGWH